MSAVKMRPLLEFGELAVQPAPPRPRLAGRALSSGSPRALTSAHQQRIPPPALFRQEILWTGPIPRLRCVVPMAQGLAQPDFELARSRAATTAARLHLEDELAPPPLKPPPTTPRVFGVPRVRSPRPTPVGPASAEAGADPTEFAPPEGTVTSLNGPASPATAGVAPTTYSYRMASPEWWEDSVRQDAFFLDQSREARELALRLCSTLHSPPHRPTVAGARVCDADARPERLSALMRAPWRTREDGLGMSLTVLARLAPPATVEKVLARSWGSGESRSAVWPRADAAHCWPGDQTPRGGALAPRGMGAALEDGRGEASPRLLPLSPRSMGPPPSFHIRCHLHR
jgi:hypothetical protein